MKKREFIKLLLLFLLVGYRLDIVVEASFFSLDTEYEEIYLPKEEETVPSLKLLSENTVEIPIENVVNMRSAESGRWIWPTADYYPVICDYLCYNNHYAIDVYGPVGTPLYAGRDGVVVQVISSCPRMSANKKECGGGYGNYITIKHADGVYSRYAHLDAVYVKMGQKVYAGNQIGTIGTSGRVGAPHLHFEIRQNTKGMAAGGWNPLDQSRFNYVLPGEKNSQKVGWIKSNNKWYFYKNGTAQKGWLKEGNQWYYLNTSGVMQTGWQKIDNEWYYLNTSGVMQTGWQKIDNEWYYLNTSGVMQTGWQKIDNEWYYLNTSGVMQTGWQKIDNEWYYLYGSGVMASNTIIDNWKIDSSGVATMIEPDANGWIPVGHNWTYYLNGVAQTGWIRPSNEWYFLDQNSMMQTGWQMINNQRYYFYDSGVMASNTIIDNWKIDENGVASKQEAKLNGWHFEQGYWYYYINNVKQKGWLTIGNKKYYLNSNGQMHSDCWAKINSKQYYFNANGEMVKGWHKWRNQWYYLNSSGEMLTQGVIDNWIITSSGMAYHSNQMNPDYVVNKSIDRLVKLDYIYNPYLNKNNSKYKTISGTPGYEEALTEAVVVHVLTNNSKEFNVYLEGNVAHIFYK